MHIFPQIFNKITRKVGVKYWLSRGRLLCAVLHHDFIPFCHVADISMLRADYLVFLAKGARYLPSNVFLQHADSNEAFVKSACEAKSREIRRCYGWCFIFGCNNYDGLQVDTFVFGLVQDTISNKLMKEKYPFGHIFPLQDQLFEGFSAMVPGKYKKILETDYGDSREYVLGILAQISTFLPLFCRVTATFLNDHFLPCNDHFFATFYHFYGSPMLSM